MLAGGKVGAGPGRGKGGSRPLPSSVRPGRAHDRCEARLSCPLCSRASTRGQRGRAVGRGRSTAAGRDPALLLSLRPAYGRGGGGGGPPPPRPGGGGRAAGALLLLLLLALFLDHNTHLLLTLSLLPLPSPEPTPQPPHHVAARDAHPDRDHDPHPVRPPFRHGTRPPPLAGFPPSPSPSPRLFSRGSRLARSQKGGLAPHCPKCAVLTRPRSRTVPIPCRPTASGSRRLPLPLRPPARKPHPLPFLLLGMC